ncbi:MAG: hypothetical protein GY702_16770, partial [Desulfobulbaceae bacterium]|nr:hypothetical protein [Desulfobulbaceae bacterium]
MVRGTRAVGMTPGSTSVAIGKGSRKATGCVGVGRSTSLCDIMAYGAIRTLLSGIAMTCQVCRGVVVGPLPACGMGAGIGMTGRTGSVCGTTGKASGARCAVAGLAVRQIGFGRATMQVGSIERQRMVWRTRTICMTSGSTSVA